MIEFTVDAFRDKENKYYPQVFKMNHDVDIDVFQRLKKDWKPLDTEEMFKMIRKRTSKNYYLDIEAAQTDVLTYSKKVFPAYEFMMPDILMDDWLSIIDPHKEGKRDHSLHQPLTAFIISELLGDGKPDKGLMINGESLLSRCARQLIENPHTEYWRSYYCSIYPNGLPPKNQRLSWAATMFYHAAMEAAMFHDIGYPWQFVNKVSGGIEQAGIVGKNSFDLSAFSILNHISRRLLIYPFLGYSLQKAQTPISKWQGEVLPLIRDAYNNTHGFPGALAFMHLNDMIRVIPEKSTLLQSECRFIHDWAAVGIMMHDMSREYKGWSRNKSKKRYRLYADTDPLSCLIALADLLEEFGRPKAEFSSRDTTVSLSYNHHCSGTAVDIDIDGRTLKLYYTLTELGKEDKKEKDIIDELKSNFSDQDCYIDLSAIGIENVEWDIQYE